MVAFVVTSILLKTIHNLFFPTEIYSFSLWLSPVVFYNTCQMLLVKKRSDVAALLYPLMSQEFSYQFVSTVFTFFEVL
jgi:hypothetical protein